jgi:hypothetical protein
MKKIFLFAFTILTTHIAISQEEKKWEDKFKQLGPELATPNDQRTASGAPGKDYWQQRADYKMNIRLDDENQRLYGEETITYFNNSPDVLYYLWMQLDQNNMAKNSDSYAIEQGKMNDKMSLNDLVDINPWFDGGFKLEEVKDASGKDLKYTINKTMMRIDLAISTTACASVEEAVMNISKKIKITSTPLHNFIHEWWYTQTMLDGNTSNF